MKTPDGAIGAVARYSLSRCRRSLQLAGHGIEGRQQARAHRVEGANGGHGDQGGNEPVFDRGGAVFVLQKLDQVRIHVPVLRWPLTKAKMPAKVCESLKWRTGDRPQHSYRREIERDLERILDLISLSHSKTNREPRLSRGPLQA